MTFDMVTYLLSLYVDQFIRLFIRELLLIFLSYLIPSKYWIGYIENYTINHTWKIVSSFY